MPSGFQLAQHQAKAYDSFTSAFMEGSAQLLTEGARIRAGDIVLDLACGTGLVARHAVSLVSPKGLLVGADINPAMLDIARANIRQPRPPNTKKILQKYPYRGAQSSVLPRSRANPSSASCPSTHR